MSTPFQDFVNTELPKRAYTLDASTSWEAGKAIVTTGQGLGVTTQDFPVAPVTSVNTDVGDVVITPLSIGAEVAGTAAGIMAAHIDDPDPHSTYTTEAEAAAAAPVQSVNGGTGVAGAVVVNAATGMSYSSSTKVLTLAKNNGQAADTVTLPTAAVPWAATTVYYVGDRVSYRNAVFRITSAHTSLATFADGTANSTMAKSTLESGVYNSAQYQSLTSLSANSMPNSTGSYILAGGGNSIGVDGIGSPPSYTVIIGGTGNAATAHSYALVGCGIGNAIGSSSLLSSVSGYNVIVGGNGNKINTVGLSPHTYGFIGGGYQNKFESSGVTLSHGTVAGGDRNEVRSSFSSVLGGSLNIVAASSNYSAVLGGISNLAGGGKSTVIGGTSNQALGSDSSVGGNTNIASGNASSILVGNNNTATKPNSSVLAGMFNNAQGSQACITSGIYATCTMGGSTSRGGYQGGFAGQAVLVMDSSVIGTTSGGTPSRVLDAAGAGSVTTAGDTKYVHGTTANGMASTKGVAIHEVTITAKTTTGTYRALQKKIIVACSYDGTTYSKDSETVIFTSSRGGVGTTDVAVTLTGSGYLDFTANQDTGIFSDTLYWHLSVRSTFN